MPQSDSERLAQCALSFVNVKMKSEIVARRPGSSAGAHQSHVKQKPSVRESVASITSTCSQVEFAQPDQTVILFDWDDTLCPSHWIRENRPTLSYFMEAPNEDRFIVPLNDLQKKVEALLKLALELGKVIIVTNAVAPWVHMSCKNFLPGLLPLVEKIPVIYARSAFEMMNLNSPKVPQGKAMPGMYDANGHDKLSKVNGLLATQQAEAASPQHWKEVAFDQEISGFYSRYSHQSWKNVISIGDAIFERNALHRVVLHRSNSTKKCRTKTAKLLDDPSIEELIAQVSVLQGCLAMMVEHDGNLDIEIDEQDLDLEIN
eukprot:gnl/MRDRNA2_/MRDRNA2_65103_c0_seq3.p1 gnl/MRDRNA2_/MRDRNA2_65103_c0~~gnl/MRDRNA2_/MRDRNA2_65103_c0_seq3.p1  ORF type:complete len:351 (+),score=58.72 gnl/MRDRNA2_/MRDRNA2_65103_c0_seq3:105-1055(+)